MSSARTMAGAKLAEPRDNPPKARMAGVALLAAGICWMKRNGRWEQVYELSPPLTSRENEPGCVEKRRPVVRATNEPTTQEERGRENEPPQVNLAAVRAQNEPTVGRGREDEPPKKDPEGHQEKGIGGFPKVQTNLELLKPTVESRFEMSPQKEGISVVPVGQHCSPEGLADELASKHSGSSERVRPKLCMMQTPVAPKSGEGKPWETAEFGRPPIGRADHWLMRGEWMIRAHGKSRVQSYSPLHSRTPLPPEELLHDCVVVKFYEGRPEPVVQNRRWLWSVDKDKDHWRGYTFFQRKMTRSVGISSEVAPTQLDPPTQGGEPSASMVEAVETHGECMQSVREAVSRSTATGVGGGYASGSGAVARGKAAASTSLVMRRLPEVEDPIEDWSVVSSEDLEEVPPDVQVRREGHHGAMPYFTAGVKGKFKGKIKGKVKGDPEADEDYMRELQRAADQEMRMERLERNEELYGPVRREPESSSSSYPTGTGTSYPSETGTSSGTRTTPTLVMTSEDGVESFEIEEDGSSSGDGDHTLEPVLAAVPEDRMMVMYGKGKGGLGKNPAGTSATGTLGLQPEVHEGHPAGEVQGQDGQQAPGKGAKMTLHLVGGGGGGERPSKGKDKKGPGNKGKEKGKDHQKGHGKKGKDDPNVEHVSTGGMHHARGTVSTTSSVVFVPGRGERRGPTFTQHWRGVAGQDFSLALTPDPRAARAKAAFQLGRVPQGRGVGSATEVVNVEDEDRERSPRPSSTSKGSGKGRESSCVEEAQMV